MLEDFRKLNEQTLKERKVKVALMAIGVVAGIALVGVVLWKSGQLFPEIAEVVGEVGKVAETVAST